MEKAHGKIDLDALESLAKGAPHKGPFDVVRDDTDCGYFRYIIWGSLEVGQTNEFTDLKGARPMAQFIAAANPDTILRFIKAYRELREGCQKFSDDIQQHVAQQKKAGMLIPDWKDVAGEHLTRAQQILDGEG